MPTKIGNGGYSLENYDENTGKYADDGILNKSEKKLNINSNELNDNLIEWHQSGGGISLRLALMLKSARIYTKKDFIDAVTKPDFKLVGKKSYREAMKIGDFIAKNNRFPNEEEWGQMVPFEKREEEERVYNNSNSQLTNDSETGEKKRAMELFGLVEDDFQLDNDFEEVPSTVKIDNNRLESIKDELNYDGFETEEGSPTFDEIYEDFVNEKNKQPEGAYDIIQFVREKVGEELKKGNDFRYKVKLRARQQPKPNIKEKVVTMGE